MRLESMWVHGLRRFGGEMPHRLRLDGKLVCIIGANEVGKSTLLQALEMSRHEAVDVESGELIKTDGLLLTRGEPIPEDRELVRVRYRLGTRDHEVLETQTSRDRLTEIQWLERRLFPDGRIETEFVPVPTRDKAARNQLAALLEAATKSEGWIVAEPGSGEANDPTILAKTIEQLQSNLRSLPKSASNALSHLADWIDASSDELASWFEERTSHLDLAEVIRETLTEEAIAHPIDQAEGALLPRVPEFVRFDKDARSIGDEYDLADPDLPTALLDLATLAGLDLDLLLAKINAGETGTVDDLRDAANAELRRVFAAWSQKPPVRVSFGLSGTRLFVHVKSGAGATMRLGERSEGLRQFVALVAMTAQQRHVVPPILLIDEVELHLHYDAQADLIGVLAEQETASQVIYSTHSAACLPEDLGSAVRVVEGVGDRMASRIRAQFWSDDVGLGTLLMAMGAASLALVLLRPAALVEGGAELVLLPSLLREANRLDVLGYQIVPGGAEVARERVIGLDLHGTATIWIYDGDQGGHDKRSLLVSQGVDSQRILLLEAAGKPLELEDLVHPAAYVAAVNAYATDLGAAAPYSVDHLPTDTCSRHASVVAWSEEYAIRPPSKVAIANKLLDLRGEMPLVDQKRRPTLKKLHGHALRLFDSQHRSMTHPE